MKTPVTTTFDERTAGLTKLDGPEPWFLAVPEMAESIVRAVPLVATPGSPEFGRFTEAAKCPIPPYRQMNELYRDAFGVLDGDPLATRRFIDGLELLGRSAPPTVRDVQPPPTGRGGEPHVHRRIAPFDGPVVPPAKTIPIFAAGAMLARAGLYDLGRFTSTVEFVMCGFEDFGLLHRAALDAFAHPAARGRFASILDWRLPECGPMPAGGEPGFEMPERRRCIPWLDWHEECLGAVVTGVGADPPAYVITSVTPLRACPGDTLTIVGTSFGTTPGVVVFRRLGGGTMEIAAATWTDTQITVKVPLQAAAGLWLKIPLGSMVVCRVLVERYSTGIAFETFDGSAPYIEALYAGHGPHPPYVVEPGELLNINWRVFGATNITVEVFDQSTGLSLARSDPAPSIGTFVTLRAPVSNVSQFVTVRIDAEGVCTPKTISRTITIFVTKDPLLSIEGIEVTQGVQHYRSAQHLTDPADYGADNSLPLVAGKAAWARVYVRSFRDPLFDNGAAVVMGSLLVERLDSGSSVLASTTLASTPVNALVEARANPVYANVRGLLDATLNFLIPEAWMAGRVRLTARVTQAPAMHTFPAPSPVSVTIDPVLNRQLRVTLIPVGYSGPDAVGSTTTKTVAAPTVADALATLADTLAMLPMTSAPAIRALPAHTRTEVLAEDPKADGGCFTNVLDLMGDVVAVMVNDGLRTDAVYVALYPTGIPQLFGGCGGGNLAVSESGFPMILAHEISHAIGRAHAPCGAVGTPDPSYPAYEPYDSAMAKMARLGEYGLDIRDGTIHRPKPLLAGDVEEHDFMSYCSPFWVSPHGYLFTNGHLPGLGVPAAPGSSPGGGSGGPGAIYPPTPLTWVSGYIEDERCEVRRVAGVELRSVPGGSLLPFVVELLDADGVRLAGASLRGVSQAGCGCGGSGAPDGWASQDPQARMRFNAYLPVLPNAARLRIRRGDAVLWERARPRTRPRLSITRCTVGRDGHLAVAWQPKVDGAAVPEVWLQWRAAKTEDWRALRVGVKENSARIPLDGLPAGSVRIRVLLHDGFSTASAESASVKVPARAPQAGIIHPAESTVPKPGTAMLLWGYAADSDGQALPGESLTWRLNGKVIGTGRTLPLEVPLKGARLRIELEARNENGSTRVVRDVSMRTRR